ADGSILVAKGNLDSGYQPTRVLRRPLPPTLLQIWSPVIAGVSITLLILSVARAGPGPQRRSGSPKLGRRLCARQHGLGIVARWGMIVVALMGLNLASAVYRPLPDPAEEWLAHHYLTSENLILTSDGSIMVQPAGRNLDVRADGGAESERPLGGNGL